MRNGLIRKLMGGSLYAVLAAVPAVAFAQNPPPQPPPGQSPDRPHVEGRRGGRIGREGRVGHGAERRGLRRINLTDAQREQLRAVESRYAQTFRTKREELRGITQARWQGGTLTSEQRTRVRQLRDELRAEAGRMRDEIRNLLTEEQRQQLRNAQEEMRQRRDEIRERREGLRQRRMERRRGRDDAPPPPPPA